MVQGHCSTMEQRVEVVRSYPWGGIMPSCCNHSHHIHLGPLFGDLPVRDAIAVNARQLYLLAGRGNSLKLADVRHGNAPASHNFISLGNQVFLMKV